jgi:hypothetical protein
MNPALPMRLEASASVERVWTLHAGNIDIIAVFV